MAGRARTREGENVGGVGRGGSGNIADNRRFKHEAQRLAWEEFQSRRRKDLDIADWMVACSPLSRYMDDEEEVVKPWVPHKYLVDFAHVAVAKDGPREMAVWKASQLGFTKLIVSMAAREVLERSKKVVFMMPTDGEADRFNFNHIGDLEETVLAWSPLRDAGDRNDTRGKRKSFANAGKLATIGGTSPNRYRSHTVDYMFLDEIDGYPRDIGGEGSPWLLSKGRVRNTRGKLIAGSTPTGADGESMIVKTWSEADLRLMWVVMCPVCDEYEALDWDRFEWPVDGAIDERSAAVKYRCGQCGETWGYDSLAGAMESGRWQEAFLNDDTDDLYPSLARAGSPHWIGAGGVLMRGDDEVSWPRYVGFAINALHSPWYPWSDMLNDWLKAQGDETEMKVFSETVLARPWRESEGEQVQPSTLRSQSIPLADMPEDYKFSVVVIDVQKDWLSASVWIYGTERRCLLVHQERFDGDIERGGKAWKDCIAWLKSGDSRFRRRAPRAVAIDVGYQMTQCMEMVPVIKRAIGGKPVMAVKGGRGWGKASSTRSTTSVGKRRRVFYSLCTNDLKVSVMKGLANGRIRIRAEGLPEGIEEELTSEHLVTEIRDNMPYKRWKKWTPGTRNEALDQAVYAQALIERLAPANFDKLRLEKKADAPERLPPEAPRKAPAGGDKRRGPTQRQRSKSPKLRQRGRRRALKRPPLTRR